MKRRTIKPTKPAVNNPVLQPNAVQTKALLECVKLGINQSPTESLDLLYPLSVLLRQYFVAIGGPQIIEQLLSQGGAAPPVGNSPEPDPGPENVTPLPAPKKAAAKKLPARKKT